MSGIEKLAETAIEVAKVQGGRLLERLLGPWADEVGLTLADKARGRRFRNQVKLLTECESYIESKGIMTKQVSLKNLVPLLEHSSLEEEESLQEKWKAMLVNYADSKKNFESNVFPYILSQMSKEEYTYLEHIAKNTWAEEYRTQEFRKKQPAIIQNLLRLGVLAEQLELKMKSFYNPPKEDKFKWTKASDYSPIENVDKKAIISALGQQFLDACTLIDKEQPTR